MIGSPTSTVWPGIVPTGSGERLGTVDQKVCVAAKPPGSVAVTLRVVVPLVTAVTLTMLPAIETVATAGFDDVAP